MKADRQNQTVVILNDYPTPYRAPVFQALTRKLTNSRVLFCSPGQPGYRWDLAGQMDFPHEFLPGFSLQLARPPYGEARLIRINPGLFFRLARLRPNVVVGYSFSAPAWTGFLYSKLAGASYVSWSTDTLHTERYLGPLQRLSRRLIVAGSGGFITASQQGAEKFVSYGAEPERIHIVTQRTLTQPFREPSAGSADGGEMTVLFVGALSARKGVEHLLRAFSRVAPEFPQAALRIVGDGPQDGSLRVLSERVGVGDAVSFAGFVQPEDLPTYYRAADLFAFPSLEDTFGVALADAVAAGLPVLASPYAGATGDYVHDDRNGFIVDPLDQAGMDMVLRRLMSDQELRLRMGRESLQIAGERPLAGAALSFLEALRIT